MAIRFLLLLLLFAGKPAFANMGSPYDAGTHASTAFSSKDIDILMERLHLLMDSSGAPFFTVEYTIQSDIAGRQIPLLFLAIDYGDSFKVWLDDKPVMLKPIPKQYTHFKGSPFERFLDAKSGMHPPDGGDLVTVAWGAQVEESYPLQYLHYFEADIPKGIHKIRVTYRAQHWRDMREWVADWSLRYSLSPAKYWRSFGKLEVTIEQQGEPQEMEVFFGDQKEIWKAQSKTWTFNKLPGDFIKISNPSEISLLAKFFLFLKPEGITALVALALILWHRSRIRAFRRKNLTPKHPRVVWLHSLWIPLAGVLVFIYAHNFIDYLLAGKASGMHGFLVLNIILYPFLLPFYWRLMWWIDTRIRAKYLRAQTGEILPRKYF